LIKAGAFDFTGVDRGVMLASVDKALQMQKSKEKKIAGQNSLFALMGNAPKPKANYEKAEPLTEKEKLQYEKEVLGFYISGHPLKAYEKELKNYVVKIRDLFEKKSGDRVRIAGVISDVKRKKTRSGNAMAILSVQDETGFIDVRVFTDKMDDTSFIEEDRIVVIEGTVDIYEDQEADNVSISMNAFEIYPVERLNKQIKAVRFILSKEKAMNGVAEKLLELCKKHKGDKEVVIEINGSDFKAEILAHTDYYVNITDNFKHDLNKILEPHEFNFE
jgi:DNA polymerase-3 subunit alpha